MTVPITLVRRVLRRNVWALALANVTIGAAFMFTDPGPVVSLQFLALVAPLPLWGAGFAVVAVLLITRRHVAGHTIALPLWVMWALGTAISVLSGTTRSPAASIALTGLTAMGALLHCNGWWFRRHEASDARTTRQVGGGSRGPARDDQRRPGPGP